MSQQNNSLLFVDAINDCVEEYLDIGEVLTVSVSGDCMRPVLRNDEKIQVRRKERYLPGDVVAYYCQYAQKYLVHRVLGNIPFQGRYFIKADNGRRPDIIVDQRFILGSAELEVRLANRLRCAMLNYYWVAATVLGKASFNKVSSRIKQE